MPDPIPSFDGGSPGEDITPTQAGGDVPSTGQIPENTGEKIFRIPDISTASEGQIAQGPLTRMKDIHIPSEMQEEEENDLDVFLKSYPEAFKKVEDPATGDTYYLAGFSLLVDRPKTPGFQFSVDLSEKYEQKRIQLENKRSYIGNLLKELGTDPSVLPRFSDKGIQFLGENSQPYSFDRFPEDQQNDILDVLEIINQMGKEIKSSSTEQEVSQPSLRERINQRKSQ